MVGIISPWGNKLLNNQPIQKFNLPIWIFQIHHSFKWWDYVRGSSLSWMHLNPIVGLSFNLVLSVKFNSVLISLVCVDHVISYDRIAHVWCVVIAKVNYLFDLSKIFMDLKLLIYRLQTILVNIVLIFFFFLLVFFLVLITFWFSFSLFASFDIALAKLQSFDTFFVVITIFHLWSIL